MSSDDMQSMGIGGSMSVESASNGKRFAVAIIDLIILPILIGVVAGLLLLGIPEKFRNVLLIIINIAWLVFRDFVFSPGRKMVGLKLVSLTGEKVTLVQAFLRNVLLVLPFVLVLGYVVEIIMILTKKERLADRWAKTRVVNA